MNRTDIGHKIGGRADALMPDGRTLEATYAGPLDEVRAARLAAAKTATNWIMDPGERELWKYVWNAERRAGGMK